MNENCIFCDIINNSESSFVFEDKSFVAFNDINPQAPLHILIVPKEHIESINEAPSTLTGAAFDVIRKIADERGVLETGYRTVVNCNDDGGQTVGHLHFHLLGGRRMNWPPG